MGQEELLLSVRAKANSWLQESYDEETRQTVQTLLNNEDSHDLVEAFYKDLEFGQVDCVVSWGLVVTA